jgi:hypothetical protein
VVLQVFHSVTLADEQRASPLLSAIPFNGDVSRYAVEPRRESTSSLELVQALVHSHEHELRDILRVIAVADEAVGPRSDAVAYTARERIERSVVASLHLSNECGELVIVTRTCDCDLHRRHEPETIRVDRRVYTAELGITTS